MFALKSTDRGFADHWYQDLGNALQRALKGELAAGITSVKAYDEVGIINRGVNIVATLMADMPFEIEMPNGEVVTQKPEYASILKDWQERMEYTIITRFAKRGAYWFLSTDARGKNIIPVLLETDFVYPYVLGGRLMGFQYSGQQIDPNTDALIPRAIDVNHMVWFWNYNSHQNPYLYPGPPLLDPALANGGIVRAMDLMLAGYFNRGGVPVTLFKIPPGQDPNLLKEFKDWLKKISSVFNAFKYESVRHDVEPVVLGHKLQETAANDLYNLQAYKVLETIGIPPSVVNSESAHDATANADMVKLYVFLLLPMYGKMAQKINEKVFIAGKSEARVVVKPKRIEALQTAFLAQAKAVYEASGERPVTQAEGREILELPPLPGAEKEAVQLNGAQLSSMLEIAKAVGTGEVSPEQGAAMLQAGYPQLTDAQISALTTPPEKPEPAPVVAPPAPPQAENEEQEPEMEEAEPDSEEVTKALAQWREYALECMKNEVFDHTSLPLATLSPMIPGITRELVSRELEGCRTRSQVRAVFDKHWPKPKPQKSAVPPQVLSLLERAVRLQEEHRQ